MKKVAILSTIVLLILAGCKTSQISHVEPAKFIEEVSIDNSKVAITAALRSLHWKIDKQEPNKIFASRQGGGWSITLQVDYNDKAYDVKHHQSTGLGYDEFTGTIHRNYNVWVEQIHEKVEYYISRPDDAERLIAPYIAKLENQKEAGFTKVYLYKKQNDKLNIGEIISDTMKAKGYDVSFMMQGAPLPQSENFQGAASRAEGGTGSGFIISNDGYIITNEHVTRGSSDIIVKMGEDVYRAMIIKESERLDLSLIKADHLSGAPFINVFEIGNLEIGEELFALGFPLIDFLGTSIRVTEGIVSSMGGLGDEPTLFQMTAAIQPGNSGGPVVDVDGRLLGVAVSKANDAHVIQKYGVVGQSLNFAVSGDFMRAFLRGTDVKPVEYYSPSSLKNAVAATVLIGVNQSDYDANNAEVDLLQKQKTRVLAVRYDYHTYFDVFVNQMPNLTIEVFDPYTGEIVANVQDGGESLKGHQGYVDRAMKKLREKLN